MANVKNYNEQGGAKTVIGGEIEILPGAKIKADSGATVEGFGGGAYTLPPATTTSLGGVKIGHGLAVDAEGTVSLSQAALVAEAAGANPTAAEFKALLDALKAAGIMATS